MTHIPTEELCFDASSYVDPYGRVFSWRGRIFRGIASEHTEHVTRLMENAVVRRLQERGDLIAAHRAEETADAFGLLLEHPRIAHPNYAMEWTPQMLKDAALLTIRLCLELSDEQLTLQDAYPWNVFFVGAQPVFIDFGSLVPTRNDVLWAPYDQFCSYFLFPLYLYSAGWYDVARRFFMDYVSGLSSEQFFRLAPLSVKAHHPLRYGKHAMNHGLAKAIRRWHLEDKMRSLINTSYQQRVGDIANSRAKFFASLLKEVEAIKMPSERSHWRTYYDDKQDMCSYRAEDFAAKERVVTDVLRAHRPFSVFDAGCNTGVYARLAAQQGACVIAVDTDEPSVSALYRASVSDRANILPLVLDVLNPTPAFGWCATQFPSAIVRYRSEMVLACALIHHLSITARQGFERSLAALDAFSTRFVLIEFVDRDDPKVRQLMSHSLYEYPWYTLESFQRIVAQRYARVTWMNPHSSTRRFVLCEK